MKKKINLILCLFALAFLVVTNNAIAQVPAGANVYSSGALGTSIPDNDPAGLSDDIIVPAIECDADCGVVEIQSITVDIDFEHTWVGDLIFTLTSPSGSIILLDQPGVPATTFGNTANGCAVSFADGGIDSETMGDGLLTDDLVCVNGTVYGVPGSSISGINGAMQVGTWTLDISDNGGGDVGTLNSWALNITSTCIQDLTTMVSSNTSFELSNNMRNISSTGPAVVTCGEDLPDGCPPVEFTDDGGRLWNYSEGPFADNGNFWTFCPDDPSCQQIEIEFSFWDVGNLFGDIEEGAALGNLFGNDVIGQDYFIVMDDDNMDDNNNGVWDHDADRNGFADLTLNNYSPTVPFADVTTTDGTRVWIPHGESGVPDAPNGGKMQATCNNDSGCLTVYFKASPHSTDNELGAGWVFKVSCEDRPIDVTGPADASIPTVHLLSGINPFDPLGCAFQGAYYPTAAEDIVVDCAPGTYDESVGIVFSPLDPSCRNGVPQNTGAVNLAGAITIDEDTPASFYVPFVPELSGVPVDPVTGCYRYYVVYIPDVNDDGDYKAEFDLCKYDVQEIWVCPPALVCNDELRVALNSDCSAYITPDHILEDPCLLDLLNYTVVLRDANGNVIANNTVDASHAGTQITAQVLDQFGTVRNSCTTDLVIQDNIAPLISCPDPQLIWCTTDLEGESDPRDIDGFRIGGGASVIENCDFTPSRGNWEFMPANCGALAQRVSGGYDVTGDGVADIFNGEYTGTDFDGDGFPDWFDFDGNGLVDGVMGVYRRTYSATDASGNTASCTQRVFVLQPFDDPFADYLRDPLQTLYNPYNADLTGCGNEDAPTPAEILALPSVGGVNSTLYAGPFLRQPVVVYSGNTPTTTVNDNFRSLLDHPVCGWAIVYEDSPKIPTQCGYKIFREWKVYDWCFSGVLSPFAFDGVVTFNQVIKVEDSTAPTISCPRPNGQGGSADDPYIVGTNLGPFSCGANVVLGAPTASDNCGDASVELLGIFDASTNALVGTDFSNIPLAGCAQTFYGMWRAVDDCGNTSSNCRTYFQITDDDEPVCVADEYTVVPIDDETGSVVICADNIDSGSYDNCSDVTLSISKRQGSGYANCLTLSCDDLFNGEDDNAHDPECPGTVNVFFKATDACGNESVCMVEVELQDKVAPVIVGGPDKTRNCDEVSDPMSLFNTPTASDNCSNATVTEIRRTGGFDDCGSGTMTITWQAEDACGNKATTSQSVTLIHISDFVVDFPANVERECDEDISKYLDPKPEYGGNFWPQVSDDDCERVLISKEDKVFTSDSEVCLKIVRTWHVINWCNNPNAEERADDDIRLGARKLRDGGNGYMTWTQVIKLDDTEAPVITCAADIDLSDQTSGCEGPVTLSATATDQCTDDDDIEITWRIDAFVGTSKEIAGLAEGSGGSVTDVFPYGTHRITFKATDDCGNMSTCVQNFTIEDGKKPSIVCVTFLSAELMPIDTDGDGSVDGGMAEIWAREFVQSYGDNCPTDCDPTDPATKCFMIDVINGDPQAYNATSPPASASTGLTFDCDDYANTPGGVVVIAVWARDAAGNWDYCVARLELQNNMNGCSTSAGTGSLAGLIQTEESETVNDVTISIPGSGMPSFITDIAGAYSMLAPLGNTYTVQPEKNMNLLEGVSTRDIIGISQHILGSNEFTSPYKLIAADADNSGYVSIGDMAVIRQLILNKIDRFPNDNTSWRFVDEDYEFADPANPWSTPFPEVKTVQIFDETRADFVGIKVGDVDGSAISAQNRNAAGTLVFEADDAQVSAGEEYTIDFTAADMKSISGYQFTMNFNATALEFVDVEAASLPAMSIANFGLNNINEGVITTSWNSNDVANLSADDVLFSMTFRAKSDVQLSEAISLNSRYVAAEAYGTDLSALDVAIEFNNTVVSADDFELYQNAPNPFNNETRIGFTLPETGNATLTIYDVTGKQLKQYTGEYAKGYNEININASELPAAGVLYYQLSTTTESATRKMILIE